MQGIIKIDMEERYIAAVDLGTSKIALTIAKVSGYDVQVVYYKETPSLGVRYSYVLIPGKVEACLRQAIDEAQEELGIKILQAIVGLPRYFVRQETASAETERSDEDSQIQLSEVEAVKSMALESYPLNDPKKETIYGAVAQSFSTDENINELENDVIGMTGATLAGNFKIFVGNRRYSINIDNVFNNLGIAIAKKYFTPGITARAVLKHEQMENGVALLDLGAGVSSVTIFKGNIMRYYAAIPFGGNAITNDIKSECNISFELAENIKKAYGACIPGKLSTLGEKIIQILDDDGMPSIEVPVKYISEVISAREKEIIEALLYKIEESGFSDENCLRAGVVITGGGANLLNCANLIKDMSGYSVKVGRLRPFFSCEDCLGVMEASASTSMGMILAAQGDTLLNCVKEPPMPDWWENVDSLGAPANDDSNAETEVPKENPEPVIENSVAAARETEMNETVFSKPSEEERVEYERRKAEEKEKKKKDKPKFKWFKSLVNKVEDTAGHLYDEMNNEGV